MSEEIKYKADDKCPKCKNILFLSRYNNTIKCGACSCDFEQEVKDE